MGDCTHCGASLADGGNCDRCSAADGDGHLRTDGGRRDDPSPDRDTGQGPPPEKRGQQPPHWEQQGRGSDREHQPQQGNQHQSQQGGTGGGGRPQSGGGPPGAGGDPGSDDGWGTLGRRELVVAGAGTAALAAGGWWVFLRGPDGAEGAVTAYLDALDDGDFDAVVNLIHEDGPMAGTLEMTEAEFEEQVGAVSVDVDAVAQYDEETDVERSSVQRFASVFAAYTIRRSPDGTGDGSGGEQPGSEQIAETLTVALHPDSGWKLWDRNFI